MLTTETRPNKFSDMVGQERTLAVLRSVLASDRIPSTFLFTGAYGSGKSSAARILAAMVNCANPVNKDACGECNSCVAVARQASDSLIEIDSAVYGSAENVRTLTELVHLSVASNYRVIILDEAHAMSKVAFTALLKVMEEAPQNVIFVLVTTELKKVPDTVRSRAVSFYFGHLSDSQILEHLMMLSQKYAINTEAGALQLIAEQAPSLRDAIKVLDVLNTTEEGVSKESASHFFGDKKYVKIVLRSLLKGEDYDDALVDMFTACSPEIVLDVVVDTLTSLYRQSAIEQIVYARALDIAWSLAPVTVFDGRGKVLTRLAFYRLGSVLLKEES